MAIIPNSVTEWVNYIQTLHVREIDMSLERVAQVYQRLYPRGVDFKVVTVAGTNGKGSTCELISSIYKQAGYLTGKFSSPHISRFNERFQVSGADVDDIELLAAFERIETLRENTRLTFFEYCALLAIDLFQAAQVDVAVMEVGLGGRLDAINILDADAAVVTSLSIDHVAWLGNTVEQIGREKIAIARTGSPCILGMTTPPESVLEYCQRLAIDPLCVGRDFTYSRNHHSNSWDWQNSSIHHRDLSLPFAQAGHQLTNAAVAVQVVESLSKALPVSVESIADGIRSAQMTGRCQLVSKSPHIVLDVAHNVDSIRGLAAFVENLQCTGRVIAVCGMLSDKQIAESLSQMSTLVDVWHFGTIDDSRGASAEEIQLRLIEYLKQQNCWSEINFQSSTYATVAEAFNAASAELNRDDCLVVFGSFFVVSDIIGLV